MYDDDYVRTHWQEQFHALVRDKVAALMHGCAASDLDPLAHTFTDPQGTEGEDTWVVSYNDGEFYLANLAWDSAAIMLDLYKLGVAR